MPPKPPSSSGNKRNIFQRLFGRTTTPEAADPRSWRVLNGRIIVELHLTPELSEPGGAVRIECEDLPHRLLVFVGDDGGLRAVCNECPHGKRRLDPVASGGTIECCSVGRSTFTYDGKLVSGAAKANLPTYRTEYDSDRLVIFLPGHDD